MSCPYSDEDLQYWDGVSNPMGDACDECDECDCEHNLMGDACDECDECDCEHNLNDPLAYWPPGWEMLA